MPFVSRPPLAALVCSVGIFLGASTGSGQTPASADFAALEKGKEALNQQKYPEAIAAFEDLLKRFSLSPAAPEATFRLGYAYFLTGDFDKSVANFQKVTANKTSPPEVIELAMTMIPQALVAKVSRLKPEDKTREAVLMEAIKQADAFLQRFPNGDEVESANFGKAIALYQLKRYDEAAAALRTNLQRFPQSESIDDSQFTLALVLGTQGSAAQEGALGDTPAAAAAFEEAEKLLREIITKKINLAMVNDAHFQLGEILGARGSQTVAKDAQTTILKRALEAYRGVLAKDVVLQAQKTRIEQVSQRRLAAAAQANLPLLRRLQRVQEKEQEKLATFVDRPEQTLTAKIKSAQIYFQLGKYDESRVLLRYIAPSAEDAETKKQVAYFLPLTYAIEGVMDQAVEKYDAFQASYKGDPIAQNMGLVMAASFLSRLEASDPEKALQYAKESLQIYPKNRFTAELLNVQATALMQLRRYDEALALVQDFLKTKPARELAAQAEFSLGVIHRDTGKTAEAIKAFREVRDKYAHTPQSEEAAYWVGQLGLGVDPKTALGELQAFITQFPQSTFLPQAYMALGQGQNAANQADAALATFQEVAAKFPQSVPAPFSYFERARILVSREKYEECEAVLQEFITQYPDSPEQFQAYEFRAQILLSQNKAPEAVAIYESFLQKRPSDPKAADALLKLSTLWKAYAEAQGPVLAQDQARRAEWQAGTDKSIAAAARILTDFPSSPAVALALTNLLEIQKNRVRARLTDDAGVESYFADLARQAEGKPGTQAKVQFTLAAFLFEKDKAKSIEKMKAAYQPNLKFAPEDLDLYGQALIEARNYADALKVYEKLARDYPVPGAGDPKTAARDIQEAQAIALAGQGKALQGQGDKAGGAKKYEQLEQLYAWSPKMLEVNYGLALGLREKKQDDDAIKRLLDVVKAPKATPELRAQSMLLLGKIHEDNQRFDVAIDNYIKIAAYYGGVPVTAAEGLWRGGQLLERQARGELPMPTPKAAVAPKKN